MTSYSSQYHAYRRATHTVGKTRQIVMLYDGVISSLQQARDAMADHRIEDRYNLLTKATQIVMGLQASLDFEAGEKVAASLYDYYSHLLFSINQLHRSNDAGQCSELIEDIKNMRAVWDDIDRQEAPAAIPLPEAAATLPQAFDAAPVGEIELPLSGTLSVSA